MPLRRLGWLPLMLLVSAASHADEAVDRQGKRRVGELASDHFLERSTGAKLPRADLRSVRFAAQPTPLAKAPPSFRLHLRSGESVGGQLLRCDAKQIEFLASFGAKRTFERSDVVGVEQLDSFQRVLAESFEGDLKAWTTEGTPAIDDNKAMTGAKSLRFDKPGQSVQRAWKPAFDEGRVSVYFWDGMENPSLGWRLDLRLDAKQPTWLACFAANVSNYTTPEGWRRRHALPRRGGWHLLQVDVAGERCRIYVDDLLLGELIGEAPLRLAGVRLQATEGKPGVWRFDHVEAAERGPLLPRLDAHNEADALLLPGDVQFFGTLARADELGVDFVAKSGKQAFSWHRLHGFTFKGATRNEIRLPVEVWFRPGPGVSPDRLFGTVFRLDHETFVLSHPVWGDVRLARDRLDRVLFHDKK